MLPPPPPALVAPAPDWAKRVNDASEAVAGRERRARFGPEGAVHLPPVAAIAVADAQLRRRLANTRLYLLPGHPWFGLPGNGTAWLAPWRRTLEALGVGRVTPVRYTAGWDGFDSFLAMTLEGVGHTQEQRALRVIHRDLAAHPLRPGERVAMLGHSYGAMLGAKVAERLTAEGIPVASLVLIETRLPDVGQFVGRVPAVPSVVELENEPGSLGAALPGTRYRQVLFPELSHMDMVLTPTPAFMRSVVAAIAGP
jgi:pimeloyl-ACP methyl ester carboxylesterase